MHTVDELDQLDWMYDEDYDRIEYDEEDMLQRLSCNESLHQSPESDNKDDIWSDTGRKTDSPSYDIEMNNSIMGHDRYSISSMGSIGQEDSF